MTTYYTSETTSYGDYFVTRCKVDYTVTETATKATLSVTMTPQIKSLKYSGKRLTQSTARIVVYRRGNPAAYDDYTVDIARDSYTEETITSSCSTNTWYSGTSLSGSVTYDKTTGTVTHAAEFYATFESYTGSSYTDYLPEPTNNWMVDFFSIPPIYYTVSYNANGGSGTVSSQTKYHGSSLTLRSNSYSRMNYSFYHWNTSSDDSGSTYSAGGTYSADANATLYAIWNAIVSYNANGGSGAPSAQTKTHGVDLTISSTVPTRSGYAFNEWNTRSDGTGTSYQPGGTYEPDSPATLYAMWKKPATVSITSVARTDDLGTPDEAGGYAYVAFSVTSDYIVTSSSVTLTSGATTIAELTGMFPPGTSTSTVLVGDGTDVLPLSAYTVTLSATSEAGTSTATATLTASASYTMPAITNVVVRRVASDSSTADDDMGRYLYATFDYNVFQSPSQVTPVPATVTFADGTGTAQSVQGQSASGSLSAYSDQFAYATIAPGTAVQDAVEIVLEDKFYSATVTGNLSEGGYFLPRVPSVEAVRSDFNGVFEDDGVTASVSVDWQVRGTPTQTVPQSLVISAYDESQVLVASKTLSPSTATGTATYVFQESDKSQGSTAPSGVVFETDKEYVITATVTDLYASASLSGQVTTAFFTMDFLAGGHGIALGKASARTGFDVAMQAYFEEAVQVAERLSLPVYEYATLPAAADLPSAPCEVLVDTGEAYICTESGGTRSLVMLGGKVTGVKGNAESTYRTGDVNITPANIGAVSAVSLNRNGYSAGDYGVIYIDTELDWMGSFTVRRYSAYEMSEIRVGGYNYVGGQTGWFSPSAEIVSGVDNLTVSFGYISANKLWFAVPMGMYCGLSVSDGLASNMTFNPVDYVHIEYLSILPGTTQTTLTLRSNAKNGHTHSNYALTSHEHAFLRAPDTRNDNRDPNWYYSNYAYKIVPEFKYRSIIGVPGSSNFVHCITANTWGDSSGGYPSQIAIGNDGYLCWRAGNSGSSWDEWHTSNAWRLLSTVYGQTTAYFSLTGCTELLITAQRGASYFGSVVIQRQALSSNSMEAYLGGGRSGSGAGGRNAQCNVATTWMTPVNIVIDGSTYTDSGNVWQVYGR